MNSNSHLIATWKSLTVLVIGDVMLDCYMNGQADRLCQEAPVPVVTITQRQNSPGGAANTAANITSLGARAYLLAVAGNDFEGDQLQRLLQQQGISTEHLFTSDERVTLAKQRVMASSQLLVRFDQGTTSPIAPNLEQQVLHRLIDLFPQCDAVIVSDYGYGLLTPRMIQTLTNLQAKHPRTLVVDSKQLSAYREVGATVVKPNYSETIQLLELAKQSEGRANQIAPYGDRLLSLTGAKIAAITLDSEGAIVFEQPHPPLRIPAKPAPPNQTSGAGDTFISAITLALAVNAPTATAASLAAAATAIVVKQPGTTVCQAEELSQSAIKSDSTVLPKEIAFDRGERGKQGEQGRQKGRGEPSTLSSLSSQSSTLSP
jgi:D-beta-D-heptose 7-phosphate kinase/D-beta-D-heptose 1-phosphate adenosyltransferase